MKPAALERPSLAPPDSDAGSQTRERLLDAAERLFADHGFHSASVRDITQAADSNLAAVNYHFGGKSNLYLAVFQRRIAALRDGRIQAIGRALAAPRGVDLEGLLRAFGESYLEPFVAGESGRRWVRLFSRELLDPQLPPSLLYDEVMQPTHAALARALRRLVPGLGAEVALLCVQSFVAQLTFIRQLNAYFALSANRRAARTYALPRLVDHAVAFSAAAVRALAPPAGGGAAKERSSA
ncbi:MAG: CerR family C-terminal domain-containing protein [Thermoanaerobaculia bacterium]